MQQALLRHDQLIERLVVQHRGSVVRPRGEGDSRFAVFALASDAVAAACAIQRVFHKENWPLATPLRIRIGVHTGEAELIAADYYGTEVNRCARLRSLAHGGQTLVSEITALLVRSSLPPGASLRRLGEVRLKDLTEPETVFQLDHPSLPRDFPPLSPNAGSPNNLPGQPTRLVGREREEQQIAQRLLQPDTRLLTLTGPGGTGKTRLALAVGEDILEYFPQGVFFVDLAVLREASAVVPAIFRAIGLRQIGGSEVLEQLVDFLQDRTVLLILDNFEHVLDAARELGTILHACAGVKLLVTSRQALHLAWERQQPVPPLSLPRPNQFGSVSELASVASIDLFVQRAQAVDPSFALDADNCRDVADLCGRLDGLPLAIELAAAQAAVLPPLAILQHLQARAAGPTDGPGDAAERHRSIGAAISWSYSRLDARDQKLFRSVGVFAGPFTYTAARDVCAGSELQAETILDGLITLVDKSLLRSARRIAHEPEFTMLETIREFAVDQLQRAGEMTALRRGHAEYYLVFAEEAARHLVDEHQTDWLLQLDREYDNLRAVLLWAQSEPSAVELGLRVAIALWRFWDIRSYLAEGRERLQSLLQQQSASPILQAEALGAVGRLASLQGDSAVAVASCLRALDIVRTHNDPRVMRVVTRDLGIAYYSAGQLDAATELLEQGVSLAREAGDIGDEAVMLVFLGNAAHAR